MLLMLLGKIEKSNCTYNEIKLWGKVKIVESFPDIKVKFVTFYTLILFLPIGRKGNTKCKLLLKKNK